MRFKLQSLHKQRTYCRDQWIMAVWTTTCHNLVSKQIETTICQKIQRKATLQMSTLQIFTNKAK